MNHTLAILVVSRPSTVLICCSFILGCASGEAILRGTIEDKIGALSGRISFDILVEYNCVSVKVHSFSFLFRYISYLTYA